MTETRGMYKTDADVRRNMIPEPDPLSVRAQLPEHVTRTMNGIKGMTNRAPKFDRIGLLRKGALRTKEDEAKKRPGADLGPAFRFVSDIPDVTSDFVRAFGGDEPRELTVYLPYRTTDEVFMTCREQWIASQLLHRCDGEVTSLWHDRTGYHISPIPCPGGCSVQGRLEVIIPELNRVATVTVLTGAKHDVMRLDEQLRRYELMNGSLTGIPFHLMRRKCKVSTPVIDKATGQPTGKRVRREKWLLSIQPESEWVKLHLRATALAALPMIEAPELTDDAPDEPEDEDVDGQMVRELVNVPPPEPEDDNGYSEDDDGYVNPETGEVTYEPPPPKSTTNGKPIQPDPTSQENMRLFYARVLKEIPYYGAVQHIAATLKLFGYTAYAHANEVEMFGKLQQHAQQRANEKAAAEAGQASGDPEEKAK